MVSKGQIKKAKLLRKAKGSKEKFADILDKLIDSVDVVLEVLDSRFIEETRNQDVEDLFKKKGKRIIYVLNKSDLLEKRPKDLEIFPYVVFSSKKRKGVKELRDRIKIEAKRVEKKDGEKVTVGVIGYPNTGKSSVINILVGRKTAGVGAVEGFTKGLQKVKLTENILLLDSPGVIPREKYSTIDSKLTSSHAKVGARHYSKVKDPEIVVSYLMNDYPEVFEKYFGVDSGGDSEILLEEVGKKKGFFKKGGKVNIDKTARFVLKEWQEGKIKI